MSITTPPFQAREPDRGDRPAGWRVKRELLEQIDQQGNLNWTGTGVRRKLRPSDIEKGQPVGSFWGDIPPINSQAQERLGYPTQKPEALLERIIKASSKESDVVMDPFCGCGTAIAVAERLHRRWIGIDVTHLAISLIKRRLNDTFGKDLAPYQTFGEPTDLESARVLAEQDRFEFQKWALGLVDASAREDSRKGADRGVDGRIYFFDDESGVARKVILQVKSGGVQARDIRDLQGVLPREKAAIGVLITLDRPSRDMVKTALSSGFYAPADFPDLKVPVVQILTIEEALAGRKVDYPRVAVEGTFKVAVAKHKTDTTKPKKLI